MREHFLRVASEKRYFFCTKQPIVDTNFLTVNFSEPTESSFAICSQSWDFEGKYDFFNFISPESVRAPSSLFYRSNWMILSLFAS